MSKKIPSLSSQKFIFLLKRNGVKFIRQRHTSHAIFERRKKGKIFRAPVITAKKELSPKYIKVVLLQLGFTREEINNLF